MKRQYLHIFASLSLLAICMMSISCGKKDESTRSEKEAPERSVLMLYMIGSDLESRSGAATGDLEEILSSGIDLALNDVVI